MNFVRIGSLLLLAGLSGPAPASPTAPSLAPRPRTRRAVLQDALRRFDEAVAIQNTDAARAEQLYREALGGFEALIDEGIRNAYLYYNTANTQVHLGEIGRAIANYRRGLRLRPADPDLKRNLEVARRRCARPIPPTATGAVARTLFFWHYDTSPAGRAAVAVAAYVVLWLLLLLRLFVRRARAALGWTAVGLGVVASATGFSVSWDAGLIRQNLEGVIIADQAVLRKGNGEGYQPQLVQPLPEGVEFRVLESRADVEGDRWLHVELPDGKDGWLRADRTEVF
ncbi:MAG: hypothetical protein ACE5E1_06695 [Phycisphaerae bacterium]